MDIIAIKNIIGTIAVIMVFAGYIPYLRDIIKGKTIPHLYSWALWALVTFIAFALQFSDHAGAGALVTLAAAIMCVVVIGMSLRFKQKQDITRSDTLFFILAFISLFLWLVAKQPVISTILTTLTDLLGFVPTIRKSWNRPHTETLNFYVLNTFRFALATFSLQRYTIITALYPVTWVFANGLFALMLIVRRIKLK